MSLKAFHLVFLSACIMLMLTLSAWCFANYRDGGGNAELVWSGVGLAAAIGLAAYTRYFLRKLRHISFL
jgi:4-amino-4-deoxy-L-arabinose transferase-like glycosyltransferase